MSTGMHQRLSVMLDEALRARRPIRPLTELEPSITIDDAYEVSKAFCQYRIARGDRISGKKIGVTSAAVQQMLGVHQPDFGFLLVSMDVSGQDQGSFKEQRRELRFRFASNTVGGNYQMGQIVVHIEPADGRYQS